MKKLFVLLGFFCALCFVACSNFQLAGGDMGVVSLSIGDNLAREIRSAAASRNVADGTYTLTASIRGEYSDSQTVTVANGNYSGVTFTFEDVPVGKRIILDLTAKADGNYIWYGNSGKHMVVSGINNLNVAVGRVSGVLLWNNSSVKIAPYGKYEAGSSLFNDSPSSIAWCFDNAGNIYWYVGEQTAAYRSDIQSFDSTYQKNSEYYSPPFYAFTHDATTDILYGIGDGGSVKYWSGTESDSKEIMDSDGRPLSAGERSLGLAAHDNVVYTIEPGGEDSDAVHYATVKSYSISIEGSDAGDTAQSTSKDVKDDSFLLPSFCTSNYTGQMIYHEGALYLLLRRVEINDASNASVDFPAEHFSIGALVKINPTTLSLDTSFGNGGYLGLSSMKKNFTDLSASDGTSVAAVDFYGSGNDASTFYGPVGFVAIMPKKLVIADAGFSMEQEGTKVNLTKKTRVITVDLETLAFETERVEDSYYQSEYPSPYDFGYSYIVITN